MRIMFGRNAFRSAAAHTALAAALIAGMAVSGTTAALAKDAPAAKAISNSKEFATAAAPLQKTLADAKPAIEKFNAAQGPAKAQALAELKAAVAGAPAQLSAAEAAIKTPGDRLLAGQWGTMVGSVLEDPKLMEHALQNTVDSGVAPADRLPDYKFQLGNAAYAAKDYGVAITALTPIVSTYANPVAGELLADAYAKQGQPAQGLAALKSAVDARKAAGQAVPDTWFTRANTIAYNAKLNTEGAQWALLTLDNAPTPQNWLGIPQLIRVYGNYGPRDALDISRVMWRSGALKQQLREIPREYAEYIQDADPRALPGEVVRVTEAGIAGGYLRANDVFVADSLAQARGRMAADKASLGSSARAAQNATTGVIAMSTGDAYLGYDEAAQAEAMYKLALAKGGVDKERALLRMGIAQYDQGRYADAKASFAEVTGTRANIAKLWAILADKKAAGKL